MQHTMYEESLKAAGGLDPKLPKVFEAAEKVVSRNIEPKMRALMTASELVTFAGHLRKNINWHGISIPINTISILIGGSGSGKGRSLSAIKSILTPALKLIDVDRIAHAKLMAVQAAEDAGKPVTKWKDFYSKPRDLVVAISTLPGWIKHLNGLESGELGAGTLYVDELSSELASSKDLMELLTALSILYDAGSLPVKALKSDESQGEAVHNLPVSALLFGSSYGFIYNEAVKKKFLDEASSKLARRSIVCFSKEDAKDPQFTSIEESRLYDRDEAIRVKEVASTFTPWFTSLVHTTSHDDLTVTTDVEDLFSDYKNYNEILSNKISSLAPLAKLHRQHRQWAALKIAGALAILEGSTVMTGPNFIEAINFIELFVDDLDSFEVELNKEPYELFINYMHSIQQGGFASMSIHQLRKAGFIQGAGSERKLIELVDLANSADDSKYVVSDKYIHFFLDAGIVAYDKDELA